jgi:hypothetical protein
VTLKRVGIWSPNYSSRGGAKVRLCVVHTAEGALTYQALGSYFASTSSGVSSHTGIDDTPNTVGEYVGRNNKAWTASNANPVAVQTELCAFAAWSAAEWANHPTMLQNTAAWIAEEAAAFGIPIVKLSAAQAQGGGTGVCQHNDLGAWGGGHWDCGTGFPIDQVIAMAAGGAPSPVPPTVKGRKMIDETPSGKGYFTTTHDGAVYAFGDAVYKGGANKGDLPAGRNVISIAVCAKDGYWLLSDGGDLYAYGSAQFYGKPDRV